MHIKGSPYTKALLVQLATNGGKSLSPLHQALIGVLLADGLPPPSDKALAELNRLYADVMANRYAYAQRQVGDVLATAEDVMGDWENTILEQQQAKFTDEDIAF